MSDATAEQESVILRIRRDIAESEKLMAGRRKLWAEEQNLVAESLKLGRERFAFAGLVLRTHSRR